MFKTLYTKTNVKLFTVYTKRPVKSVLSRKKYFNEVWDKKSAEITVDVCCRVGTGGKQFIKWIYCTSHYTVPVEYSSVQIVLFSLHGLCSVLLLLR